MILRGRETGDMQECKGTIARLQHIAGFAFQMDGTRFSFAMPWQDETVVEYLLSLSSFVIVGDSLSAQLYSAMRSIFGVGHLVEAVYERRETLPSGKLVDLDKSLHLARKHPLYAKLSELAPAARLAESLVRHIRSHHLLTEAELVDIFDQAGGQVTRTGYPWGDDPDWLTIVQERLATGPVVLLLSTGAHWSTSSFRGLDVEQDADSVLLKAYSLMCDRIIASLPDRPDLHVIVKGMSPGRATCSDEIVMPDLTPIDTTLYVPQQKRYNYHLFQSFNDIWREKIRQHNERRANTTKRIEFWDVWNITAKRHEAYSKPSKGDCLHFCLPVIRTLVTMLMHKLMSDTAEAD